MDIELLPMTRERMHELYRGFEFDPDIFDDMELYGRNRNYVYDPAKVDALYDMRADEKGSIAFAVTLNGAVIGEVGLRHADEETKECELSIHLRNDSVKNLGYGTAAEHLAVRYAFDVMGMEHIVADSLIKNTRSQHVLEKVGFEYIGEEEGFRLYILDKDKYCRDSL
ncbi:MAG: GNAT family N-acetyltransferase [Eubacteriaceae bacterium]|nr:GNAT family N-acetyltransferase [Eubacteriaceae bacterium]